MDTMSQDVVQACSQMMRTLPRAPGDFFGCTLVSGFLMIPRHDVEITGDAGSSLCIVVRVSFVFFDFWDFAIDLHCDKPVLVAMAPDMPGRCEWQVLPAVVTALLGAFMFGCALEPISN